MKYFSLNLVLLISTISVFSQESETVYALNKGVTTNEVSQSTKIQFGQLKDFPHASYIRIREKSDGTYYISTTVGGEFGYGHYFKYVGLVNDEYKYIKTDGDQDDYVFVNYPLSELANSNKHDEHVILKLVNYRTSFAMLMMF